MHLNSIDAFESEKDTPLLFVAKMPSSAKMGMIHRLGGGFGSGFRLGIGCSVTAYQNEITAKRRVSGYRAHLSRRSSLILTRDVRRSSSGSTIVAMMQTVLVQICAGGAARPEEG